MSDERLLILNMVKEGRISVEEAESLLDALKGSCGSNRKWDAKEETKKVTESVDSFVRDFSNKLDSAFKDVEPAFKKATKKVLEKTTNVVDKISKSLHDSLNSDEENNCDVEVEIYEEEQDLNDDTPVSNGEPPREDKKEDNTEN